MSYLLTIYQILSVNIAEGRRYINSDINFNKIHISYPATRTHLTKDLLLMEVLAATNHEQPTVQTFVSCYDMSCTHSFKMMTFSISMKGNWDFRSFGVHVTHTVSSQHGSLKIVLSYLFKNCKHWHGAWCNDWATVILNVMVKNGFMDIRYRMVLERTSDINPSPLSAAYMRHWIGSGLVQRMACRLCGAKPLTEPMLSYCKLDHWEQTSMKFESKYNTFHSCKCPWKCRVRNDGHFVQGGGGGGGDELRISQGNNALRLARDAFSCFMTTVSP